MAKHRPATEVRRFVAALSGVALATASLVAAVGGLTAAPAAAAHGDGHYVASASPLSHDGVDFSDQPIDDFPPVPPGPGAVWFATDSLVWAGEDGNTVVPFGPDPVGFTGGSDVDVALVHELDGSGGDIIGNITVYLDAAFGAQNCDGALEVIDDEEVGDVECVAFKSSVLVAQGADEDYVFAGFDGFTDTDGAPLAEDPAVVDGFATPPSLVFVPDEDGGGNGGGGDDVYLASYSPLIWNGTDYPAVHVFTSGDTGGVSVGEDDTPIPLADGTHDYDVALALIDGNRFTFLVDSELGLPTADCAGFQLFLDSIGPGNECDNFKAGYFVAQGVGEPYAFSGFDGFEQPGEVAVMAAFTTPPSLQPGGGGGGGGTQPPAHGEGHESEYVASVSPLEFEETVYGELWPSGGPNPGPFTLFVTSTPDHFAQVPYQTTVGGIGADHFRPVGVPGADGFQPFHAVLTTVTGDIPQQGGGSQEVTRHLTLFVDDGVFEPAGGPQFATDCPGFEELVDHYELFPPADDALTPAAVECVAFHADVLTPNGPRQDFTFHGFTDWTDGDGFPMNSPSVAQGFADPSLEYSPHTRWFASSVSPWTFAGIDFTDRMWEPSADPEATGVNFGTAIEDGNEYLFATGQRPRGIPSFAGLNDFGVALVEIDGRAATFWWEDVLASALGITDCPSMVSFLEDWVDVVTSGAGGIDVACHAFSVGTFLLAPDGFCEDYTYVQGSWTGADGDPIDAQAAPQITEGFDDTPSLAWVGPDSVCAQQEPPPEGSGPGPGAENPTSPSGGGDDPAGSEPVRGETPGSGADPAPASGTLPRSGTDALHLVLVALAMLFVGTALTAGTRRHPALPGFSAR